MTAPFAGKTALVTGGAKGIGRAIAERLAQDGARVAITATQDMAAAEKTAAELSVAGADVRAFRMELTDRGSVHAAIADVIAAFGSLDIAVNNAGTSARGRLLDLATGDWDKLFAIHTRGFFHLATAAARVMRPGSAIIAIAGASALRCYPGAGAYGPSKAAVLATARQMAVEWAPLGIRVNCVCPGPIRDPAVNWQAAEPALAEEVTRIPLARAGTPPEVAEAVAYLAAAHYVTGQEIAVDGGSTTTWYIQG